MVRINLIDAKALADQHLVAEYNEILMLFGHVKKHPVIKEQPEQYVLGPGHINFFKNKLLYLARRHEHLKKEMRTRGFTPTTTINLGEYPVHLHQDHTPNAQDLVIIKERLKNKIREKPRYYRYYGERKTQAFFIKLIEQATIAENL